MGKNRFLTIAGILNAVTASLHIAGGQVSLVDPLLKSQLDVDIKAEWLGGWHMITTMLVGTTFLFFYTKHRQHTFLYRFIGYQYLAFGFSFLGASLYANVLAPQWILLFPIGIFSLLGSRKGTTCQN